MVIYMTLAQACVCRRTHTPRYTSLDLCYRNSYLTVFELPTGARAWTAPSSPLRSVLTLLLIPLFVPPGTTCRASHGPFWNALRVFPRTPSVYYPLTQCTCWPYRPCLILCFDLVAERCGLEITSLIQT